MINVSLLSYIYEFDVYVKFLNKLNEKNYLCKIQTYVNCVKCNDLNVETLITSFKSFLITYL